MAGSLRLTPEAMSALRDPRKRLNSLFDAMWAVREANAPRWKDIARYMCPMRPSFLGEGNADGQSKALRTNNAIVDSTAIRAARIMTSGLLAATANPGSDWFELAQGDRLGDLDEAERLWLRRVRDIVLDVYERTNFYTEYEAALGDQIKFATGAYMQFEEPGEKVVRFESLPIGSYAISQNAKGRVDTLARQMSMTARQLHDQFGEDALPDRVIQKLNEGHLDASFIVRQLIEPNPRPLERSPFSRDLPWREFYWVHEEVAVGGGRPGPLGGVPEQDLEIVHEGGYHEFPAVVLRWQRNPEDAWGTTCPAFEARGDMRELQIRVRRLAEAEGKMLNPPMLLPAIFEGRPFSIAEAAKNHVSSPAEAEQARSALDVRFPLDASSRMTEELRRRVESHFQIESFLAMLSDARTQPPTAEEVRAREREKAALIGPISEKNADDGHDPTIDRTVAILMRRSLPFWERGEDGILPQPPGSLEGRPIRVVYVSEVDKARKIGALIPMERHLSMVLNLAATDPTVLDTVDMDAVADISARANSVHPSILRVAEAVAQLRQQREEAQARARQLAELAEAGGAAKDLSKAQVAPDNALGQLVGAGEG